MVPPVHQLGGKPQSILIENRRRVWKKRKRPKKEKDG
jgi:hypothetical protein